MNYNIISTQDAINIHLVKSKLSQLSYRSILNHKTLKNKDGSPLRVRVNGKLKTWKTRIYEFQLPMKHGLKDCFYINETNYGEWAIE